MGFATAFTIGTSLMQYQAQGAIGKYNQAANNRTAAVLDGQAAQIEQKAEFDIAQFNKTYQKVKGETTVALAKSGVANFARIKGTIARQQSKLAQIGTIASAGTSLITMNQGSFGTKSKGLVVAP